MNIVRLTLVVCGLVTISFAEMPQRTEPIYVANQNPLIQLFGLPKPEAGDLTPKGKLEAGFFYSVSNGAIDHDSASGEAMIWDGETSQYNLRFRYGLLDHLELGVDIPYVKHGGGYLDSTIRHFHDLFSFPNDRQESFEKNQIHYQVSDHSVTTFEMQNDHSGLGDIRISVAAPLIGKKPGAERFLAVRSLLKLPTGDSDDLLGSGGTDLAVGLSYSDYRILTALNSVISLYGGLMLLGDSDILSERQEDFAGYGGGSYGWQALTWLDLKVQLDFHSAMYDSTLDQLGTSMQLSGGGTIYFPYDLMVDLGMTQNTLTDSTPDVGFYLFVRRQF